MNSNMVGNGLWVGPQSNALQPKLSFVFDMLRLKKIRPIGFLSGLMGV